MTIPFPKGRLSVRMARTEAEVAHCQALRHLCFFGSEGQDADEFDDRCRHLMVTDEESRLVATARLQFFADGRDLHKSYAAQCYDLSGLSQVSEPMVEVGRFCIASHAVDADVLRLAWGALTGMVDGAGVRFLFGCSSFAGTEPQRFGRAFARLVAGHLGPDTLRPSPTGGETVALSAIPVDGQEPLPPLLRTYLAMGGWVGGHVTIDRQMNTLHLFTCVDVKSVPPARAKALRALAQGITLA